MTFDSKHPRKMLSDKANALTHGDKPVHARKAIVPSRADVVGSVEDINDWGQLVNRSDLFFPTTEGEPFTARGWPEDRQVEVTPAVELDLKGRRSDDEGW